jgi:hypothetical protein
MRWSNRYLELSMDMKNYRFPVNKYMYSSQNSQWRGIERKCQWHAKEEIQIVQVQL